MCSTHAEESAAVDQKQKSPLLSYNVEGVGNPESNIIPRAPLSTGFLDGLQVMVSEHKLPRRQAGLCIDSLGGRKT